MTPLANTPTTVKYASGTEFEAEAEIVSSSNAEVAEPRRGTLFTAEALMNAKLKPVTFIVQNLIPEGLTILAGIPKSGKSWLALNICRAVAVGDIVLGMFPSNKANALYIGYEDSFARLQSRIACIGRGLNVKTWPSNFYINNDAPMMAEGGFEYIKALILELELGIVFIDTMFKFTGGSKGNNVYVADYSISDHLHKFALDNHVAIVAVHHAKKGRDEEGEHFISKLSGSYGVSAGADTIIVVDKKLTGPYIAATGRDIDEFESPATFDKTSGIWSLAEGSAVSNNVELDTVELFRNNQRGHTIAEFMQLAKLEYGTAKQRLYRLRDKGLLEQEGPLFRWKATIV